MSQRLRHCIICSKSSLLRDSKLVAPMMERNDEDEKKVKDVAHIKLSTAADSADQDNTSKAQAQTQTIVVQPHH